MAGRGKFCSLCCLALCIALLFHGSRAQTYLEQSPFRAEQRRMGGQSSCRLENLRPQDAQRRVESEAGLSEFWNNADQQFDCAGVAVVRNTIESRGLQLPEFSNSPRLVYIVQGSGISGVVIPGCPETFQSFEQSQRRGRREDPHGEQTSMDQHQKIRRFRRGDIIALPAGVAHWCYNNGETPVVAVTVFDVANHANQLDRSPRRSFLAGRQQSEGWQRERGEEEERSGGGNIFRGFDDEILSEALGVSREVARKLKSEDDRRGTIIRVQKELRVSAPMREREEEEREEQEYNGLEETLCNMRLSENIADPAKFDIYSRQGGHITTLNSQKLPILKLLRLSAEKGHLRQNGIIAPLWNINAHSVIYVIRGEGRMQISGAGEKPLFDGTVRRGQILVVPQGHAVVKQAAEEEFEWVSFKTNDYAMVSPLAGKTSVLRGIPMGVLANSYRISEEDVRRIKFGRDDETLLLHGRRTSQ